MKESGLVDGSNSVRSRLYVCFAQVELKRIRIRSDKNLLPHPTRTPGRLIPVAGSSGRHPLAGSPPEGA